MTNQEAKAYLMQYRISMNRSAEIEHHLRELKAEADNLKDHEGQSIALDAAVAKYVDACRDAEKELDTLAALRIGIRETLNSVQDSRLHSLLWRRYISGFTWEQVAVSMAYTYRRVTQLHGDALKEICDIMKDRKDFLVFPMQSVL